MSDFDRGQSRSIPQTADMSVDAGLRAFMLGVYNKMAMGLVLSAALAYGVANFAPVRDLLYVVNPATGAVGYSILGAVLAFAPLVLVLASSFLMRNLTAANSGALYWAVVSLIGVSGAVWVLRYTGASIASTFLITATAFGALSLFGYTTKRDLTGFGSFLIMAVWGLLVACIATWFFRSPMLYLIVSVAGVLIFAGLTAYDTQRLKMTYYQIGGDSEQLAVATNFGALHLYLDFINMFQFLLALLGGRR
ncbi:MAG: Bax inhibitor-1/YccA family protein [Caulobacter sp.]|nr:Bax inhibitor-1/YccA family protein [Caulobacter sp.]